MKDDAHLRATAALLESVSRQVGDAIQRGETLDQARKAVDLAEHRRIFAGDSPQRAFIFRSYVEGPAVQERMEYLFRLMTDRVLWTRGKLAAEAVTGGVPGRR